MNTENIKIVRITPVSITLEFKNDKPYYSDSSYDIYINDFFYQKFNTNVVTIFDLIPGKEYSLKAISDDINETFKFKTLNVNNIFEAKDYVSDLEGITNVHDSLQSLIDKLKDNDLLIFNEGEYLTTPLMLKENATYYIKKNATIKGVTDRALYPVFKGIDDNKLSGTWEGEIKDSFMSLISIVDKENITIVGEGTIDGNANNSDWWVDVKNIRIACRPNLLFINRSKNINVIGPLFINSPAWTIHPYYSTNLEFINVSVKAYKYSPNTDGLDPESSTNVKIIGSKFSTGDDCIAIKSGKISMVKDYYQPSENILIDNCLMEDGHAGVAFGSEASSGIKNVTVKNCYFNSTDRGLRIKTRRGRGDKAEILNVDFDNIYMNNVKSCLTINAFYNCDSDGHSEYCQNKNPLPVDERTPHLGAFHFKNMVLDNVRICAGFFYGLPEKKIEEISLDNIKISFTSDDVIKEEPVMMDDIDKISKEGFIFHNVKRVIKNNIIINEE